MENIDKAWQEFVRLHYDSDAEFAFRQGWKARERYENMEPEEMEDD